MDRWNTRWGGRSLSKPHASGYILVFIASSGSVSKRISVGGHRIVWEMHHGPIPEGMQIDHVNRDRSDNRLQNIRLATISQNHANKTAQRNNASGHKGVYWCNTRSRWIAKLVSDGRHIYIGSFKDLDKAAGAYAIASAAINKEFAPLTAAKEQGFVPTPTK